MIVMKFGGASVEDAQSIERITEIISSKLSSNPVVVVSAMGKTTRRLLKAAESSASGDRRTTLTAVAELKTRHLSELRRLVRRPSAAASSSRIIEAYFEELKKLLEGLAVLGDVPPRGLDKILSYGELLSAAILHQALSHGGVPAQLLDARQIIKTDDRYGSASPIFDLTNRRIQETVLPAVEAGSVPILQGFIGTAPHGATTTLGFEGSDYTAAIVGAAIDASEIQIWKTVPGLMTADPAIFEAARTVKHCSYAEAAELTYHGAKVLHQKAVYPAAEKNIPVRILDCREPSKSGSLISSSVQQCSNSIKSIAYRQGLTFLYVSAHAASQAEGSSASEELSAGVIEALKRRRIESLLSTFSASSALLAVDSDVLGSPAGRYFLDELSGLGSLRFEKERAIVSIVGDGLRTHRNWAAQVFKALDFVEVSMIAHGSSAITMSFAIQEKHLANAIARLHQVFFSELDQGVFE